MSTARTLALVHDVATAVLALAIVPDPFTRQRTRSDFAGYVEHQQRVDRVMRRVGPVLSVTAAATGAAAVAGQARRQPAAAAWRTASVLAVAAAVVLTVRVHVPVNEQLRSWSPGHEAPGWREARARWERAHVLRRGLVVAALTLVAAARAGSARPLRRGSRGIPIALSPRDATARTAP